MERSYLMLKPGFVTHENIRELIIRLKEIGVVILRRKYMQLTDAVIDEHYAHVPKEFLPDIKKYMTSDVVVGMVVEGPNGSINKIREIVGPTKNAPAGTIRGDFKGTVEKNITKNVIHASDSIENANIEITRFFISYAKYGIKEVKDYEK